LVPWRPSRTGRPLVVRLSRTINYALREWFDELERQNLDRLEEGAKMITQLVTGLYGVLFAVLGLSDQPVYLKQPTVQGFGVAGVALFFIVLLAALVVVYPWRTSYQQDNLSSMQRAQHAMRLRKVWGLRVSLCTFVADLGCLAGVIMAVLWAL
jgi:hypothetical protein